jgi:hypothetical protein
MFIVYFLELKKTNEFFAVLPIFLTLVVNKTISFQIFWKFVDFVSIYFIFLERVQLGPYLLQILNYLRHHSKLRVCRPK